jgi:succinate dehydrogenase / fumarate reductase iron-sulfur subunit
VLNEHLLEDGKEPVAFDHDCREGICGACSMVIDGHPHGPRRGTTACQLHMREYHDGAEITVEPWRASAFPVVKDLVVDRSAFDRIQRAGGYISINTGAAPEANGILIGKHEVDEAMDYAACIGCGACVAACPNASAMLFVASKVAHLALLPQGQIERRDRVRKMVEAMDSEGFGGCTNHGECSAHCPKLIPFDAIALLNREYIKAGLSR